jgi:glycerol-3-phosphate cytidylyltransferase
MNVGFTCGAFDLLHPGHLAMLAECKKECDYLIVGLHSDPTIDRPEKNKPIQTLYERWMQLKACKFVDEIIPYDTEKDLVNMMGTLEINTRFIGADHQLDKITGQSICERRGINIVWNERSHDYSSSELRGRLK